VSEDKMARRTRLDGPGALHHVRARGIERRPIFVDDADREDFLGRLSRLADSCALTVYAWALMPNHFHLLVRTGTRPLERSMRALLAGYATRFNRRHERAGHLFQNRYKSTLCEEEPYFLELVRYIHLNPVPSVVPDLTVLARYPYAGHSAVLGRIVRKWHATDPVLGRFADERPRARALYEAFVRRGATDREPALEGGGLVEDRSGWRHVQALAKGRERFSSNERILGTGPFVERTLRDLNGQRVLRLDEEDVIALVCRAVGVEREALDGTGRTLDVVRAREGIAHLWTVRLGGSGRAIARCLGLAPTSVYEAAERGRKEAAYWSSLLGGQPDEP
jgi:REP element-mobilizing transposase RayT